MRTPYALGAVAAVVIATSFAACGDDSPVRPSNEVQRVEINGPSSIAPGQTASYSVIEYLSNGTSRALPTAAWASSNASLIQITSSGVATAQPRTGESTISVKTTKSAGKEVTVMPPGTFRLVGTVTDADQTNVTIPDAQVEVMGGGPSVTTNAVGTFRLYGVPGDSEIRVTREGYRAIEERLQLSTNTTRNFRMSIDGALRNYGGNYTLVVEARANCGGPRPLATEWKRRTYDATVLQNGSKLEVQLTEPRFVSTPSFRGDRFGGAITPVGANFLIEWDYYYSGVANITERLPDGSTLYISGSATTSGSPSGLSGVLSGFFDHYSPGGEAYVGGCQAERLSLTPR
jgi:hypothetical protein